jgi:peptidoglycan/LPS O-acetylase OafA/YrhL
MSLTQVAVARPARAAGYRPDIDGLRAVAVGLVVAQHAGLGPFSGGYIGVDVFFVISGYLITGLIVDDLERGTFSFRNFYERRARRILPALLTVILVTTVVASLVMPPTELQEYARALPPSLFFYANTYMRRIGDYFGPNAHEVPLLHL